MPTKANHAAPFGSAQDKPLRANLAKIHIAKKELGLTDESYRDILHLHFKVDSASKLNDRQCTVLLNHLKALGWKPKHPAKGKRPFKAKGLAPLGKEALLGKIEAHLAERKIHWNYAHAMAKRICKVDRVEFCDAEQLRKLVAAFEYDSKRKGLEYR